MTRRCIIQNIYVLVCLIGYSRAIPAQVSLVPGLENTNTSVKQKYLYQSYEDSTDYSGRVSKREGETAVVLVVHELSPLISDAIKKLESLRDMAYVRPLIMYDEDRFDPEKLTKHSVPFIPMSRRVETARFPKIAFNTYSGIYQAPAKPAQVAWMANQNIFDFAWFIEGDVYFSGEWFEFVHMHANDRRDLLVPELHQNENGFPNNWLHWESCDVATVDNHSRAFIPVHRISKKLATTIFQHLISGGHGHHECLVPGLCQQTECAMGLIADELLGVVRYRPSLSLKDCRRNDTHGKFYHPVKTQEQEKRADHISAELEKGNNF